jgi:hypothetical protein
MHNLKRRLGFLSLITFTSLGCGQPEVSNETWDSVIHAFNQSHTFEIELTDNGNALDEVNAVVNFGVHAMTPGAGSSYSADVQLTDCQLLVPYTFNIRYDSNHPDEAAGFLIENEPPAGAYILRRTNQAPGACRVYEGLSFNVSSTADLVDVNPGDGFCASANGPCTLRAAIMEANARPGHDRITLSSGPYVLSLAGNEDLDAPDDAVGDLDITDGVSIVGPNGNAVIDADHIARIFQIDAGIYEKVNLTQLTLQNGHESGEPGGAIFNASSTKLERVEMTGNQLSPGEATCAAFTGLEICNRGGAIFNSYRMLLRECTVRGNNTGSDSGQGGGISNFGSSARLYLESSTIAENSARFIGGLHNYGGRVEAVNTTFADNSPLHWVSAIYTAGGGAITLRHVTFSESQELPVIVNSDTHLSTVTLEASVVHIGSELGTLCTGDIVSNRDNFVGGSDPAQDYLGSCNVDGLNPEVGELHVSGLGWNGGGTDTIEINPGAGDLDIIDTGSLVCPNFDQRGEPRTGGTDGAAKLGCDPGAVEHELAAAPAPGAVARRVDRFLIEHQAELRVARERGLVDRFLRTLEAPSRADAERALQRAGVTSERTLPTVKR